MVLDKTGTLTLGRPAVTFAEAAEGFGRRELVAIAASAEALSEHPAARAIAEYARAEGVALREARHFAAHPGRGASAVVEGRRVLVGSPSFLAGAGVDTAPVDAHLGRVAGEGATPVVVAVGGVAAGVFGVADTVRPGASEAVEGLKLRGRGDHDAHRRRGGGGGAGRGVDGGLAGARAGHPGRKGAGGPGAARSGARGRDGGRRDQRCSGARDGPTWALPWGAEPMWRSSPETWR